MVELHHPADVILEIMRDRRQISAKSLIEPGPSTDQIEAIFYAAAQAPDHGLIRPWRFVQVPHSARDRLAEAFAAALRERSPDATAQQQQDAREKAMRGPFLTLAIADLAGKDANIPVAERLVSLGCALQNMLLMAYAQRYAAGLLSGAALQSQALRAVFSLAETEQAVCFIVIGTAARDPKPARSRPKPDAFVSSL